MTIDKATQFPAVAAVLHYKDGDDIVPATVPPAPPTKSVATPTIKSGTITTGGTAQVLMAANSSRSGIEFFNNSVGSIWLNVVGTATAGGGSIEVRSGGYWSPPVVPVTAISIIGATTGQAFTCWEYA